MLNGEKGTIKKIIKNFINDMVNIGFQKDRNVCDIFAGSITLETALVLPIFMFATISMLSAIELVYEYTVINDALYQVGEEVAYYSYPLSKYTESIEELDGEKVKSIAISETYVRGRLIDILSVEWLKNSMVKDGFAGLHLYRSSICESDNEIDLVLTYKVKPWFSSMGIGEFYLVNRCRLIAWTGYEKIKESETLEGKVYVAENGEVYHLYRDCTHLNLSIDTINKEQLFEVRNDEGEIYKPCEYCYSKNKNTSELVYITDWGNRYHSDIGCSGLKRTVSEVNISQTGGKRICLRCEQRKMHDDRECN